MVCDRFRVNTQRAAHTEARERAKPFFSRVFDKLCFSDTMEAMNTHMIFAANACCARGRGP